MVMNDVPEFLPLNFSGLTEELVQQAKLDFNEEADRTNEAIGNLRSLIKGSKTITFTLDDAQLMPFLRARKYDVKKAYLLLENHVAMIRKHDILFKKFCFSSLNKAMYSNAVGCLPKRDSDGCVVIIFFLDKWNPQEITYADIVRAGFLGVLASLKFPATQIAGVKIIQDYKNLTLKKLSHMPPWVFKFIIDSMQNILPMRVKGLHIFNNGYLFYYIWSMLKPLLSSKIKERIHFHGNDAKSLHKFISPSILPNELGGYLGPHDNEEWIKVMIESADYITSYINQIHNNS